MEYLDTFKLIIQFVPVTRFMLTGKVRNINKRDFKP